MIAITDLPDEVLLIIIQQASTTAKSRLRNLYNFSLVCRVFYNVSSRELFRNLYIQPSTLASIYRTLTSNPRLCRLVQRIFVLEKKGMSQRRMKALIDKGIWITEWEEDQMENEGEIKYLIKEYTTAKNQLIACLKECCLLGKIQKISVTCHFPFEKHGSVIPKGFVDEIIAAKPCRDYLQAFSYSPPWITREIFAPLPLDPAFLSAFNVWTNLTFLDLWALAFPPIKDWPDSSNGPSFRLQKLSLHECIMDGATLLKLTRSSTVEHKSLQELCLNIMREPTCSLAEYQDCVDQFMNACSECTALTKLSFALGESTKLKSPLPRFPSLQTLELNGDGFDSLPASIPSLEHLTLAFTINIPLEQISRLPYRTPLLSTVHIRTIDPNSNEFMDSNWEFEPADFYFRASQMPFHFIITEGPTTINVPTWNAFDFNDYEERIIDNICHLSLHEWPPKKIADTMLTRDSFLLTIDDMQITCLDDLLTDEDEDEDEEDDDIDNQDPDALFQPSGRQLRRYEQEILEDERILRQAEVESDSDVDDIF